MLLGGDAAGWRCCRKKRDAGIATLEVEVSCLDGDTRGECESSSGNGEQKRIDTMDWNIVIYAGMALCGAGFMTAFVLFAEWNIPSVFRQLRESRALRDRSRGARKRQALETSARRGQRKRQALETSARRRQRKRRTNKTPAAQAEGNRRAVRSRPAGGEAGRAGVAEAQRDERRPGVAETQWDECQPGRWVITERVLLSAAPEQERTVGYEDGRTRAI